MAAHPTEHRLSPLSPSTNDVHTCALRAQLARNRKTMAYAVGVDRYAVCPWVRLFIFVRKRNQTNLRTKRRNVENESKVLN